MLFRARGDEIVIPLDEPAGAEHELTRVGGRIWQLCDGRHTLLQIAEQLTAELQVDPREARMDVTALVAQLCEMRLLQLDAEQGA